MKKLLLMGAVAVLAVTGALAPQTSQAAVPGWYFVSVCVQGPSQCPSGPSPIYFGVYTSQGQCLASWAVWKNSIFGQQPWALTNCYYQP